MERLKQERRWCVFDKNKKPYVNIHIGGKSNEPDTWLSYKDAEHLLSENRDCFSWMGFFISQRDANPSFVLCVIDVDAHETDENPLAERILELFKGTYIEKSPSGKGYHIICDFELSKTPYDENGKRNFKISDHAKELELYIGETTHKALTYTGDVISETREITDQTDQVLQFIQLYMSDYETLRTKEFQKNGHYETAPINDNYITERLNIARRSQYKEKFIKLYDKGDVSDFNNDHSLADMYLVKRLCYWLGPHEELIDKAFRGSRLYREKWDERRGTETYGKMTIRKAIDGSEKFYEPIKSSDDFTINWGGILPGEDVGFGKETPDLTINRKQITPEDVLQLIDEAQEDISTSDKISVFNLQCGTGKSTAIRLKIRQVIEANNGDGLIVITDSLDRMRDYVQPDDPELQELFKQHADKIAIMTHENFDEVKYTQRSCPVLIMSTQRYIYLTPKRIEDLICWENGNRSLIIVDEKPYFLKQIDITEEQIKSIGTAIDMGIPNNDPDKKEMSEFWNRVLCIYLTECIHRITEEHATTDQGYMYWKPPWFEEVRFNRQFALAEKHMNELNSFHKSGEFVDIYSIVRAVMQLLFDGALLHFRKLKSGVIKYSFSILLHSIQNYRDISSKVIILDGTADLSVEYEVYSDCLDIRPCDDYKRELSRLHICIYQGPTGKTRLQYNLELREKLLAKINEYQRNIYLQAKEQPVIFSYKMLKKNFNAFCDEQHYDWFGNIRGKNDYRKAQNIIQVGLNVFPLESYFLFEMARYPELVYRLQGIEQVDTMEIIRQHIDDPKGFTKEAAIRELLAELEQNIFRGTIRNSNNTNDYVFHLFISKTHEKLIEAIGARYKQLNADVPIPKLLIGICAESDRSVFERAVYWHDTELINGDEYTISEMAAGIGVDRTTVTDAAKPKSNKQFSRLLLSELVGERTRGRTAKYVKQGNWSTE